jgi:hypothetical protein
MIRIGEIARHRDGISGEPFYVVKFTAGRDAMLGIIFDAPHHVAVFDRRLLSDGNIAFGSNSFRAEEYERPLRAAIEQWEQQSRPSSASGGRGRSFLLSPE